MGAKTWMLVYAEGDVSSALRREPKLDRVATRELIARLYGRSAELPDGSLLENANPASGQIFAGCFPGLTIVCTEEVALDHPSRLDRRFIDLAAGRTLYLHAMHSVVDWFAFAVWTNGTLTRALSLSPDSGVLENIGKPMPFETPYWEGKKALELDEGDEPYPLPFHPLELAEDALRALFGFNYEGEVRDDDLDLETIVLAGFSRKQPWWRRIFR